MRNTDDMPDNIKTNSNTSAENTAEEPENSPGGQLIGLSGKPLSAPDDEPLAAMTDSSGTHDSLRDRTAGLRHLLARLGFPEMAFVRLIAAFFSASWFELYRIRSNLFIDAVRTWKDFVPQTNAAAAAVIMLCIYIMLTILHNLLPERLRIADQLFAAGSVLAFAVTAVWYSGDFYLIMSISLVSLVLIGYSVTKGRLLRLFDRLPRLLCFAAVILCAAVVCWFVSYTTIMRHRCFGSTAFDFGIFVQMFHSLANDLTAVTTCERDRLISHFHVHASYIFYLLVPVFRLFPCEDTLLIAQAVLSMGGIIPMYLMSRRHGLSGISLIFMCLAYTFCSGIIGPCYYDFHENAFLPTLLMWLLWAADGRNYPVFWVMSALTCIVKEDAPLYVVCIGLFMFFSSRGHRGRINGVIAAAISLIYMLLITDWLTKHGDGQMMTSSRFGLLMIDKQGGLAEVVKNALLDPTYFFSTFIHDDTLKMFLEVMLPLLFVPFMTRNIHRYLLMLPFIIMNMVVGSWYGYAANIGYQYIHGPICLLLYMCVINLDDLEASKKPVVPVLMGSAAVIMSVGLFSKSAARISAYNTGREYYDQLEKMLDDIPQGHSVCAGSFLLPHIADRDDLYLLDRNDFKIHRDDGGEIIYDSMPEPEKYDYYAVQVKTPIGDAAAEMLEESGFTVYDQIEDWVVIYQNPDIGNNGKEITNDGE